MRPIAVAMNTPALAAHELDVEEVEADQADPGRRGEPLVQGAHDRATGPHPYEERADDCGDDRPRARRGAGKDGARERARRLPVDEVREQHRGDRRHDVRLEQVGRHPGAVADVVADVVGDDGGIARVVLRDARLDLADEVGADVRALRVDAAAHAGEQAHQRCSEEQADHAEDVAAEGSVESDELEEGETGDRETGDASAPERIAPSWRRAALPRAWSAVRTFARTLTSIPTAPASAEPGGPRTRKPTASLGPFAGHAEREQDEDGEDRSHDEDGRVLAPEERDRAFADRRRDRLHLVRPLVLAEQEGGLDPGVREGEQRGEDDHQFELPVRERHLNPRFGLGPVHPEPY